MAELILTEEEKKLDISQTPDDVLGKALKYYAAKYFGKDTSDGAYPTIAMAAAYMLVGLNIKINADDSKYSFDGVKLLNSQDCGDWVVTIKQKRKPKMMSGDKE